MLMAGAQDLVLTADSRRLVPFSCPIVMLSWLSWHRGRKTPVDTLQWWRRRQFCHPDTDDWSRPDSTQVDYDRSHHLHLTCTLSVLLLFSVLWKGSRGRAPQGRPEKKKLAKGSKVKLRIPQQFLHLFWHIFVILLSKISVLLALKWTSMVGFSLLILTASPQP